MKRQFLDFRGKRHFSAVHSRRGVAMAHFTGGGGSGEDKKEGEDDPDASPEQKALLKKIKDGVAEEVRKLDEKTGKSVGDAVQKGITKALEGLDVDALRSFKPDDIATSVRNLAAQFEKLQNGVVATAKKEVGDSLRSALTNNMDRIGDFLRNNRNKEQFIKLDVRAAEIITTAYTPDNSEMPVDLIDSYSIDAFVPKRRPYEYVFDFADRMTVSEVEKYRIWMEEGDEEGAFAIVAEGGLKPLVSQKLVRNKSEVKKVAGKEVFTDEFAKFKKEAYRIIRQLFNDKLLRDYQDIVTTTMQASAAGYVGTSLDGQYTAPTDYHAIGAVAAQIETLNFNPDTLIIHPQDKWRIGLSQDTTGAFFVNIPVYNPSGEVTLMGFRVITSTKQTIGSFTLGEGRLFKIQDEMVTIKIGYGTTVIKNGEGIVTDVEDDLDHNRFRIIGEMFFHAYIATNNLGSFVTASFASVKAALTAA